MIFMHAKRRVSEGVYVCDEGDVFTLAGLAMQVPRIDSNPPRASVLRVVTKLLTECHFAQLVYRLTSAIMG